jgi:hypothetical protein
LSTGYQIRTSDVITASAAIEQQIPAWLGTGNFLTEASDRSGIRRYTV